MWLGILWKVNFYLPSEQPSKSTTQCTNPLPMILLGHTLLQKMILLGVITFIIAVYHLNRVFSCIRFQNLKQVWYCKVRNNPTSTPLCVVYAFFKQHSMCCPTVSSYWVFELLWIRVTVDKTLASPFLTNPFQNI